MILMSGRQDSNLRIRGPKPRPLDLSDTTRFYKTFK